MVGVDDISFWGFGRPIFRDKLAVSFREGSMFHIFIAESHLHTMIQEMIDVDHSQY